MSENMSREAIAVYLNAMSFIHQRSLIGYLWEGRDPFIIVQILAEALDERLANLSGETLEDGK